MNSMYTNPIKKHGDFADPFVLRYQGRYYLYCTNPGVKCWTSTDLLNWQYEGTVVPEDEFPGLVPFAPEVVYENGCFYMYTSPHGLGHYVLKRESPLGPFRKVTPNIGHSIDFSVFLDEDGRRYAYWADDEGILGCEMPTPTSFGEPRLVGAYLYGWTEGPFVVKKDGIYHLTYTGNHFLSKGYRVCEGLSERPLGPYTDNERSPLLVRAEGGVVGLGHSSTVLAPDLTSHYIFYHNLNADKSRDLNMERVLLERDGSYVLGSAAYAMPEPCAPDYASDTPDESRWTITRGRATSGGFAARLNDALPARGAAEINLRCTGGDWGIALESEGDKAGIRVCAADGAVIAEINGKEMRGTPSDARCVPDAFHCVRLEWSDGLIIHIDNLLAATLPAPCGQTRLSCWCEGAAQIGYHAYAACGGQPPFPDEAWLPHLAQWRQLVRSEGNYSLIVAPEEGRPCEVTVNGSPVNAREERGTRLARVKLPLNKGLNDIALSGAAALAVYPAPEDADGFYRIESLGPEAKRCAGEPWDDAALDVRLELRDKCEGWEAGVLLRASQLAEGGEGNDPVLGRNFMLGYSVRVSCGRLSLWKHRYDARRLAEAPLDDSDVYCLRIDCVLNRICVSVNGHAALDFTDALPVMTGRAGVQAKGCVINVAELTCKAAERID